MARTAAYAFGDLVQACRDRTAFVWPQAVTGAAFLHLYTQEAVMRFIAEDIQIESLQNSKEFEKWGGKPPVPMVDAYIFLAGPNAKGYLAFYFHPGARWNVKSFCRDMYSEPAFGAFSYH